MTSTDPQRYARHLALPEVGADGQRRLAGATVTLIGAGGLGSPAALYLAAAGIGHLRLIDDDHVELSNLQRQVLHTTDRIGQPKADSAAVSLSALNPTIAVTALTSRLTHTNADMLLKGSDIIIDGSDNFATRYLVADWCEVTSTPLAWGSIDRFTGQWALWHSGQAVTHPVGLRDLYPTEPDPDSVPTCAQGGVLGVLPGLVGIQLAILVLGYLLDFPSVRPGVLHTTDVYRGRDRSVTVAPAERAQLRQLPSAPAHAAVTEILASDLAAALAGPQPPLVVDVRESDELAAGIIPGSIHSPLGEFLAHPQAVLAERGSNEVVLYCAGGVRSATGCRQLAEEHGLPAKSLRGGYAAWAARG